MQDMYVYLKAATTEQTKWKKKKQKLYLCVNIIEIKRSKLTSKLHNYKNGFVLFQTYSRMYQGKATTGTYKITHNSAFFSAITTIFFGYFFWSNSPLAIVSELRTYYSPMLFVHRIYSTAMSAVHESLIHLKRRNQRKIW